MIESFINNGKRITIHQDEDAESSREFDNLGTMVCFHKRYSLGDKDHGFSPRDFGSWGEVLNAIQAEKGPCVVLPIYMYDHSGISVSTTRDYPFNCPWDAGQVGFIFVAHDRLRREMGYRNMTKKRLAEAAELLRCEVETYNLFLTGQVFGYEIEGGDSCWGFYGIEHARQEAKAAAA